MTFWQYWKTSSINRLLLQNISQWGELHGLHSKSSEKRRKMGFKLVQWEADESFTFQSSICLIKAVQRHFSTDTIFPEPHHQLSSNLLVPLLQEYWGINYNLWIVAKCRSEVLLLQRKQNCFSSLSWSPVWCRRHQSSTLTDVSLVTAYNSATNSLITLIEILFQSFLVLLQTSDF